MDVEELRIAGWMRGKGGCGDGYRRMVAYRMVDSQWKKVMLSWKSQGGC